MRSIILRGLGLAMGNCFPLFCYGTALWFGAYMVGRREIKYSTVLTVVEAMIYGAWCASTFAVYTSDFQKAKRAAYNILRLVERKPMTRDTITIVCDGDSDIRRDIIGDIRFDKVEFAYPSRSEAPILQGLSFTASHGQTVALVGGSGSGKSTCIQLLEKFYTPLGGQLVGFFLSSFLYKSQINFSYILGLLT